jgi:hypothetical protein
MANRPPIPELIDSLDADYVPARRTTGEPSHRASIQFHWFQNVFFQPFGMM